MTSDVSNSPRAIEIGIDGVVAVAHANHKA